jgi:hypothetical protein
MKKCQIELFLARILLSQIKKSSFGELGKSHTRQMCLESCTYKSHEMKTNRCRENEHHSDPLKSKMVCFIKKNVIPWNQKMGFSGKGQKPPLGNVSGMIFIQVP